MLIPVVLAFVLTPGTTPRRAVVALAAVLPAIALWRSPLAVYSVFLVPVILTLTASPVVARTLLPGGSFLGG